MKNLTVNMPLAVPHQRPPSKYASHPYPILYLENINLQAGMRGSGAMFETPKDDFEISANLRGQGQLRSVYQYMSAPIEDYSISHSMVGSGTLKSIYVSIKSPVESYGLSASVKGSGAMKSILIRYRDNQEYKISAYMRGTGELK